MSKKVLFISDSLGSGGAQRQIVTVSKLLKKRGYDVAIVCYHHDAFFLSTLENSKVPVVWLDEANYIKRIFKVRRFVRRGHYDVVISFLQTENLLNVISALGGKKWKVICGERSSMESLLTSTKGRFFSLFLNKVNSLVCNSENARDMWIKHYPQFRDKYLVIYNNVQLGDISTSYIPLKDYKLHLVVAASYQFLKNPIGLINALHLMSDKDLNKIVVDWYGHMDSANGDTSAYLQSEALIKEYQLQNVMHLHDANQNIQNIMNQADVIGLFSWLEGLPNAICEGMMMGKPIIMTRVSDYMSLIDESNGVLCDWNNYNSIKDALLCLMNQNEDELLNMGANSKKKAQLLFSEDIVAKKWISLIEG